MTMVQRYDNVGILAMRERLGGEYVLYSDYTKLEARVKELEAESPIKIYEQEGCVTGACLGPFAATGETRKEALDNLLELIETVMQENETKIRELEAENRWIPVEEDVPDYDEYVMFFEGKTGYAFYGFVDKDGNPHLEDVTHWKRIVLPNDKK